jgi:hypothetical protein
MPALTSMDQRCDCAEKESCMKSQYLRVLLADDQDVVRTGVRVMLEAGRAGRYVVKPATERKQ